ncbi:MAG: type VI secretion system tube protein Hcp [Opitutales bacterium]|nr:type VI secretion system tube protein Hcp [Opitutales bacterium]
MLREIGKAFALLAVVLITTIVEADEYQAFFRISSIPGDITINNEENWNRASLLEQDITEGGAFEDQKIVIQKEINQASPLLAYLTALSNNFPEMELIVFDPQNPATPFFHVVLSQVRIHQFQQSPTRQDHQQERITFRYHTAEWTYTDFLMWGDEEGLEYVAMWDNQSLSGSSDSPEEGHIPEGAYKLFREGLQVEKTTGLADSLQLSWPAQKDDIYDIHASTDLQDDFDTHIKAVQAVEDGTVSAIVEIPEEHDRMFFIVRLRLEE